MVLGFVAIVPTTGYAGWKALEKTSTRQKAALEKSPVVKRELAYFKEKIAAADTPEKLMKDKRLLMFVLTSYRLEDDISKKALIQKALSEPTTEDTSLVNKLSDKRWKELAVVMGYGDTEGGNVSKEEFLTTMTKKYLATQWETSVGEQDPDMETALYAQERLVSLSKEEKADKTGWYNVISEAPLRKVFQAAFKLPDSFASLSLDRQKATYEAKAKQMFGEKGLSQFQDPEKVKELVKKFFVMKSIQANSTTSSAGIASSMLSSFTQSLFASRTSY